MSAHDISPLPPRGYLMTEVMQMLGKNSVDSVWKLAQRGALPGAYKVGNQWRVNRAVFDAYLQGQSAAA